MKVLCMPEHGAIQLHPNDKLAMISITEPERNNPASVLKPWWDPVKSPPPAFEGWKNLLRLTFHDIDLTKYRGEQLQKIIDAYASKGQEFTPFTAEHAFQIFSFVKSLPPEIKGIIVHCSAGILRSAGIAKFLSDHYQIDYFAELYEYHNKHVYKTLAEVWRG